MAGSIKGAPARGRDAATTDGALTARLTENPATMVGIVVGLTDGAIDGVTAMVGAAGGCEGGDDACGTGVGVAGTAVAVGIDV
jgi:hypothetical protein